MGRGRGRGPRTPRSIFGKMKGGARALRCMGGRDGLGAGAGISGGY